MEEKTLGQLISTFSQFSDDDKIISQLNEFNSFRKKVVHHLLDHPLDDLNKEAKRKQKTYNELVSKLSRYNIVILDEISMSYKQTIAKYHKALVKVGMSK